MREGTTTYRQMVADFPALCVSSVTPEGSVIASSFGDAYAQVSGYDLDELEGDPGLWLSIVHPADGQRVQEAYRQLASGTPMHERYRIYRKDGQITNVFETGAAGRSGALGTPVVRFLLESSVVDEYDVAHIHFRQLVDDNPVGISVRDLTGRVLYCNKAYAHMFGYESPHQMLGTDFRDIMGPLTLEEFHERAFPKILEGAWAGEVPVKRKDGSELIVKISTNVFRDTEGAPVAAHAIVLDITDLRRTEEALRKSGGVLEATQDALPASLAVIDADGTITTVNERWRRFARENGDPELLHTCEGINYLDVCKRATGAYSEGAADALAGLQAILSGQQDEFEMEYPCPSPTQARYYSMRASSLCSQGGAVVAHIDISERKRAEDALRESEARYHSLLENLEAIVYRMDPNFTLLAISGRVFSMLGYTADELLDDPSIWRYGVHPDDAHKTGELLAFSRTTRAPHWIEFRVRHKSGRYIWILGTVTPIFNNQGELIYYDGVSLDVTDRVEAQQRDARHSERMSILTEISQKCASTLDPREILDIATQQACFTLDCVAAAINVEPISSRLLNLSLCCPKGCDVKNLDREIREADLDMRNVFGTTDMSARIVPDLSLSSPALARFAAKGGLKPGIIAPVIAGEDVLGVLLVARKAGEQFEADDLWFLSEIAAHASAALANALLYHRQTRIAETLQRTLIPPEPAIAFLDIATLYAPAPGEARVGGDFFDVFRLDGKRVGLVVGDVSGKGVEAAIHTAEAKYMLRAYAHQDPDPLHVITELNGALFDYLPTESFITLAYFLIDVESHTMSYVNAGHETCLALCRDERSIRDLSKCGPVLGVTPSFAYSEGSAVLYPDDFLFCYTDGVTDVRTNGDRLGFERLRDMVISAPAEDANNLMRHVMDAVRAFGISQQTDDQVVVVLRPIV